MDGLLALMLGVALVAALVALGAALLALARLRRLADRLPPDGPPARDPGSRGSLPTRAFASGALIEVGVSDAVPAGRAGTGAAASSGPAVASSGPAPASSPPAMASSGPAPGIGLVRFNAFDDTGGSQSFALALLDPGADGFVLSSLHSRQATRLYVKRISAGTADMPLSDEESEALEQALRRDRRKR